MSRSARRLRKQLSRQKEVDVRFIQNDYDALPQKKTFTLKDLKQIKPLTKTQEEAFYEWYDSDKEGYYNDVVCLTGAAGTGKCVTKDTLIPTNEGLQYINEIYDGPNGYYDIQKEIFGLNGIETATKFYKESEAETLRITTNRGYSLSGTNEHPVYTLDRNTLEHSFKRLDELSVGDIVCIQREKKYINPINKKIDFKNSTPNERTTNIKEIIIPEEMTSELAEFLGYYVANGSNSHTNICISTYNKEIQNRVLALGKFLFGIDGSHIQKEGKEIGCIFNSVFLVEFVRWLCGGTKTARYKTVPVLVRTSSVNSIRAFLRALFDCDASFYDCVFQYSTASQTLATEIHTLLLEFGIVATKRPKLVKGYDHTYWNIDITSNNIQTLFAEILKNSLKYVFPTEFKKENQNLDVVPGMYDAMLKFRKEARELLCVSKQGTYIGSDGNRKRFPAIFRNADSRKNPTYNSVKLFVSLAENSDFDAASEIFSSFLEKIKSLISRNFYYDIVREVEYTGKQTVYDFTVPGTHSFVGNGFINHNTMLACYMGVHSILDPDTPYDKLIIVRSAVASRDIGFLPGEENDKVSVYKQPYHYLFDKFFSYTKSFKNMEDIGMVQFECTSFLRGVTFDNAIVVLDECQDTTAVEFETVLTRLGKNSRMFVVGDIWQNDLGGKSGFNEVLHVLKKTEGVSIVEFGVGDIVRSGFVKNYLVAKHTR